MNVKRLGALHVLSGEYVYPSLANKKSQYQCPDCNDALVLCKGDIRVPYFRHGMNSECSFYTNPSESQIHKDGKLYIKSILDKRVPVTIERVCYHCHECEEFSLNYDDIKTNIIEYAFEYDGKKKADVASIDEDGNIVCIYEILHKHRTRDNCRPEPWFEFEAEYLSNLEDNIDFKLTCTRRTKCDDCLKLENKHLKFYNCEKYIRIKLGQTYPIPKRDENGNIIHRRFFHDTHCQTHLVHNNNILNLFSSDFTNGLFLYKVMISAKKHKVECIIVKQVVFENYEEAYLNNDSFYMMDIPHVIHLDFTGSGTVDIIHRLLKTFFSLKKKTTQALEQTQHRITILRFFKNNFISWKHHCSKKRKVNHFLRRKTHLILRNCFSEWMYEVEKKQRINELLKNIMIFWKEMAIIKTMLLLDEEEELTDSNVLFHRKQIISSKKSSRHILFITHPITGTKIKRIVGNGDIITILKTLIHKNARLKDIINWYHSVDDSMIC
jgi:hypothetical protein